MKIPFLLVWKTKKINYNNRSKLPMYFQREQNYILEEQLYISELWIWEHVHTHFSMFIEKIHVERKRDLFLQF